MMMNVHSNTTIKTYQSRTTIKDISDINYSIVHRALRRIDVFKFNIIRSYFPNLKSLREFVTDAAYLGGVKTLIESRDENPTPETLFEACMIVRTKSAVKSLALGKQMKAHRIWR